MKRLNDMEVAGLRATIQAAPTLPDGFRLVVRKCKQHFLRVSPSFEDDLRFSGAAGLRQFWRSLYHALLRCEECK